MLAGASLARLNLSNCRSVSFVLSLMLDIDSEDWQRARSWLPGLARTINEVKKAVKTVVCASIIAALVKSLPVLQCVPRLWRALLETLLFPSAPA